MDVEVASPIQYGRSVDHSQRRGPGKLATMDEEL